MLKYQQRSSAINGDSTSIPPEVNIGNIQITNVTSGGIVSNHTYLSNTIPANQILTAVMTDSNEVTIHFIAEPSTSQSPVITIDSIQCTNLQQFTDDRRLFYGSVNVSVPTARIITVASNSGKWANININKAGAAPIITDIRFVNGYPSGQTEVKENDILEVMVTFNPLGSTPTHIEVENFGIAKAKSINLSTTELNFGTVNTATFTISTKYIGNVAQFLPIRLRTRNSFGTQSEYSVSTDFGITENIFKMKGCDLVPSIILNNITYPSSQGAFKDSEVGLINITVNNYSTVSYSSPTDDFSIVSPSIYSQEKTIICNNPNIYNDSIDNIRVFATRSENGTSYSYDFVVEVADTAPVINVYHSEVALRSTEAGYSYVIHANSNQKLANSPNISIPVSGVQSGENFTGADKIQQRNIIITDADAKGTGAWLLESAVTNKAGIPATITGNQVVSGFRSRTLTVGAFGTQATLTTQISNINNVFFSQSFKTGMAFSPIGTSPPVVGGQTISALNTNPTTIIILDTQATFASSIESQITIEENVY